MSPPSTVVDDEELVSVIVPVRNGAPTLQLVLDGLLSQSYQNIEVLISDNASTDETPAICEAALRRDGRVKYARHREPLTAVENFRYWLDEASGQFILFAAHDDLRDRDFVRLLVAAAQSHTEAVCIMPSVASFHEYTASPFEVRDPAPEAVTQYSTKGAGIWKRLGIVLLNGFPCYGLLRRDALREYPWLHIDYAPDLPLVSFLAVIGEVVVERRAMLYYWVPERPKSPSERAVANSLRPLKPFGEIRVAWACGHVAAIAAAKRGFWMPRVAAFAVTYAWRRWMPLKQRLYDAAPHGLHILWRRTKARFGWPLN